VKGVTATCYALCNDCSDNMLEVMLGLAGDECPHGYKWCRTQIIKVTDGKA